MSHSRCPKCESTSFEIDEETVEGSRFKLIFVRCKSCKTAIGVLDYYNIGNLIHELAQKLDVPLNR